MSQYDDSQHEFSRNIYYAFLAFVSIQSHSTCRFARHTQITQKGVSNSRDKKNIHQLIKNCILTGFVLLCLFVTHTPVQ